MSDDLVKSLIDKYRNPNIGERYSFFPIKDEEMYEKFKEQESAIWSSSEMEFSRDLKDYLSLTPELKRIIDLVNCFFSATDGLIIDNIALRFLLECKTMEEQSFYISQMFIETVHAETYSLIINTLITDPDERQRLFMAANNLPCVQAKTNWLNKHMTSDKSRSHRLLVFACGEGIFFTSSFLFVFYFRTKGVLQNIIFANEQISKDEGMHRDAGLLLHKREGPLTEEEAHQIVREAVELEFGFVDEVLPEPVEELNASDVKNYVRFLGDHLLISAGYSKLYNIDVKELPTWMNDIAMEQKSNFYEVRVGNYKQTNLSYALDWRKRITGNAEIKEKAYQDPLSIEF